MERARTAAETVEWAKEQQAAERVMTLEGDGPGEGHKAMGILLYLTNEL
jgi:hypothetical protein